MKWPRIKIPEDLKPDARDVFMFAGLAGVFYGLWGFDPRLSFLVVGGILTSLAVIGQWRKG